MQINGSQIMIECLLEQGVDTIFGYPGGSILNVYDELYSYQDRIRHVLTSHEQGASHAADGYARATGKVGVCMATSGPGATNLVTGIATAYMDSVPMVAITCNVTLPMLGKDSFQEVDIAGVTMPITKHSFIVKDVKDLAAVMRRAFKIGAFGTYALRKHKFACTWPPAIANMVIVPFVLRYGYGFITEYKGIDWSIPFNALTVGIGEVITCVILGSVLLRVLNKYRNVIFHE